MVCFWSLGIFIYPQYASVYSAANEYQHWWEGTCDGLASCPGESVHLHSNCLANIVLQSVKEMVWSIVSIAADRSRKCCHHLRKEGDDSEEPVDRLRLVEQVVSRQTMRQWGNLQKKMPLDGATIGVRDGGQGGQRAVCRHEFGQRGDIIRAKHNTCLNNTNLGSVTAVNGKKNRI